MRIIYQLPGRPAAVVIPCDPALPIEQVGRQSVPAGVPFWVVGADSIPSDRSFRNAWELDVEGLGEPSGYGEQA